MPDLASICGWDTTQYLIISDNVFGKLVYYSHILPLLISMTLAAFVFVNNKKILSSKLLLIIASTFSLWSIFDLILWATDKPHYSIFFWSLLIYLEPIIYAGTFYLVYVLIKNRDLPYKSKLIYSLFFIPIIILGPTSLNLLGYDFTNCDREAIEGPLWLYTYAVELVFVISIMISGLREMLKKSSNRKEIAVITLGALLFLLSFSWGNITGSIAVDWELGQYGLFGLPIFMSVLAYVIIRYKKFNVKLISAQAIIALMWIILFSILFVRTIENIRIITGLTLIIALVLGLFLIRSVKREVEQREKIERLAKELSEANDKLKQLDQMKSEFLSLATHQIRSPLTSIKGYASLLLEGDYGKLDAKAKEGVQTIYNSCDNLVKIVGDFLNISRIEQGRMVYNKDVFDMASLTAETITEYKPEFEKAGIELKVRLPGEKMEVNADKVKIKQIIGNLIDNAIKYTPKGSIEISVFEESGKIKVSVKDTGIGIEKSEIIKLFNKFSRTKDAHLTNVTGTGLGLYVAKKMAEAQGYDITVSSPGSGQGSTFTLECPR